jgi:hypothetical protein
MESYYSAREMAEIPFIYGRAKGNSWEACGLYAGHDPQYRNLSHTLLTKLHE